MQTLTRQMAKDIRVIGLFTEIWCGGHRHDGRQQVTLPGSDKPVALCAECAAFVDYAVMKRRICPLESEKPSCKHCRIHCYAPQQRAKVRQIMAWSGKRMLLRGRLDYLRHYFF